VASTCTIVYQAVHIVRKRTPLVGLAEWCCRVGRSGPLFSVYDEIMSYVVVVCVKVVKVQDEIGDQVESD